MFDASRNAIYDYLCDIFEQVSKNVYEKFAPQELTNSDAKDGFLVVSVGDLYNESEFSQEAYGWVRCYVEAYVPLKSRGRADHKKDAAFEDKINAVIKTQAENESGSYTIREDHILSSDYEEVTNGDNPFSVFVKSFIVEIN